ncbi:MAG: transposase family protein [Planctomycetia bacterium]|nr:MAG: transposase family protein [Planctomycetia bacterium]
MQEVRYCETRETALAKNPFYTKRFAHYVGRKCRAMTVKDVAKELKLDWHTVKALEKEYLQEQLRRNPVAAPRAIGIDEISQRRVLICFTIPWDRRRARR